MAHRKRSWFKGLGLMLTVLLMIASMTPASFAAQGGNGSSASQGKARGPSGPPQANKLHPQLVEAMSSSSDGLVTAIVRVDSSLDLEPIKFQSDAVIAALKEHAAATQDAVARYVEENGGEVLNSFWIANMILIRGPTSLIQDLTGFSEVTEIVPNFQVHRPAPLAGEAAPNTNVTWGLEKIGAPEVWAMGFTGQGVRVAVLDTGVDISHPDLTGRMYRDNPADPYYGGGWMEFDSNGNRVTSMPNDSDTHGTHVSGTVLGGAASGTAIGVAPGAELMHGLVIPGGGGSFAQVAAGMQWAIAPVDRFGNPAGRRADVVNMSLGGTGFHAVMIEPTRNMYYAGTFPSFSIGNSGNNSTGSPGNVYEAVGVGASDVNDNIASFSSGGVIQKSSWTSPPAEWPSSWVKPEISAPGVSVLSALPGGGYGSYNGTSMASPHMAGSVALMLSANSSLTVDQILETFIDTSFFDDRYGAARPNTRFGHGRINTLAAVQEVAYNSGIKGTVTSGGAPLAGAAVTVGSSTVMTNAAGHFQIVRPPGSYTVSASKWGYESGSQTVNVVEGQYATANFSLTMGERHTISGVVTFSADGVTNTVPGMTVAVTNAPEPVSATTDASGAYSISIPAGTYNLQASGQGLGVKAASVTVGAGGVTQDFGFSSQAKIALLGDNTTNDWLNWLQAEGYDAELKTLANLGDPAQYGLIIYNRAGSSTAAAFNNLLAQAQAAGTGILFLDTWSSGGNGIAHLKDFHNNPSVRNTGYGSAISPGMYYRTVAEHPVLAGIEIGTDVLHDPGASDHDYAFFSGFTGEGVEILADVMRPGQGVLGNGIAVRQTAGNRHVLLSMHGSSTWSKPAFMSPASLQIMRNAIAWAGRAAGGAKYAAYGLQVSPGETLHGQPVTVSAQVKNIGSANGSFTATLRMNGNVVGTQNVSIDSGATKPVTFNLTAPQAVGTYTVELAGMTGSFKVRAPKVTVEAYQMSGSSGGGGGGGKGGGKKNAGDPVPAAASTAPLAGAHVFLLKGQTIQEKGQTDANGQLHFDSTQSVDTYTLIVLGMGADGNQYLLSHSVTVNDDTTVTFAPTSAAYSLATLNFTSVHPRHKGRFFVANAGTMPYAFALNPGKAVIAKGSSWIIGESMINNLDSVWSYSAAPEQVTVNDGFTFGMGGAITTKLENIRGQAANALSLQWVTRDAAGRTIDGISQSTVSSFSEKLYLNTLHRTATGTAHKPNLRVFDPSGLDVRAGSIEWNDRPFQFSMDPASVKPGAYTLRMTTETGPYSDRVVSESNMIIPARSISALSVKRGGEFEITVAFDSPTSANAASVKLQENLPAGFTVMNWNANPPVVQKDYKDGGWTWNRRGTSTFQPGQTITITYRIKVESSAATGMATISGTVTDSQFGARTVAGQTTINIEP